MSKLKGKVSVITGAGSGIGKATALAFATEGARLVLCDNQPDYLDELSSMLSDVEHSIVVGDVANEQTSIEVAKVAHDRFGSLDVMIGGVGMMFYKDITDVTVEEFDRLIAVNVRGMFLACKHAIPAMLDQKKWIDRYRILRFCFSWPGIRRRLHICLQLNESCRAPTRNVACHEVCPRRNPRQCGGAGSDADKSAETFHSSSLRR
jgi:NAD(P)-dependent dehydrogenase (short-subunit alcohol dehydrogenase family)